MRAAAFRSERGGVHHGTGLTSVAAVHPTPRWQGGNADGDAGRHLQRRVLDWKIHDDPGGSSRRLRLHIPCNGFVLSWAQDRLEQLGFTPVEIPECLFYADDAVGVPPRPGGADAVTPGAVPPGTGRKSRCAPKLS